MNFLIGPVVACVGAAVIQSFMVGGADTLSSNALQGFLMVLCFWFYVVAYLDGRYDGVKHAAR